MDSMREAMRARRAKGLSVIISMKPHVDEDKESDLAPSENIGSEGDHFAGHPHETKNSANKPDAGKPGDDMEQGEREADAVDGKMAEPPAFQKKQDDKAQHLSQMKDAFGPDFNEADYSSEMRPRSLGERARMDAVKNARAKGKE